MTEFTLHDQQSAPEASKSLIKASTAAFGFLPNLLAGMAESPALLEGYTTLAGIFDKTSLNETERQIVLMTNNRLNGCNYCMAAHTTIAQGAKVPTDVIDALRNGSSIKDKKLEALRQFSVAANEQRGWVSPADLDSLFEAGYTKQTALEVILGTSLKVMSNYTNHIVNTPVDSAFQANSWTANDQ